MSYKLRRTRRRDGALLGYQGWCAFGVTGPGYEAMLIAPDLNALEQLFLKLYDLPMDRKRCCRVEVRQS